MTPSWPTAQPVVGLAKAMPVSVALVGEPSDSHVSPESTERMIAPRSPTATTA
jgi:hypothetical protein